MKIRLAITADYNDLSLIYLESRKTTFTWIDPARFALSDFERDTKGEDILVIEDNGKIYGFISIWMTDRFIHHLYVSPSHTRKGLGIDLLKSGLIHVGLPARLKCVIRNSNACHFYEANGWRVESTNADGDMGPYNTYVFDGQ